MEGEEPYLGGLLTMVINHLLTGIILQVGGVGWLATKWTVIYSDFILRSGPKRAPPRQLRSDSRSCCAARLWLQKVILQVAIGVVIVCV